MRTANFRKTLFGIGHQLGVTPGTTDLAPEAAAKWCELMNTRLDGEGWRFWDWPELRVVQERAFAPIWQSSTVLSPRSPIFYLPTFNYYQVKTGLGPPIGTLPTDTMYFEPVTIGDRFIPLDNDCNQAIGEVLGVYNGNPRRAGQARGLNFWLSEKGIDIPGGGNSVFVYFRIRPSQFTTEPYDAGTAYGAGDLVYFVDDGEVYRARTDAPAGLGPAATAYWAKVPLPERLATYLKKAVAADATDDLQNSARFEAQAQDYLQRQADLLVAQGNLNFYQPFRLQGGTGLRFGWELWSSVPADGATTADTTTLTDECVDPWGESEGDMLVTEDGDPILTDEMEPLGV